MTEKNADDDIELENIGELHEEFPNNWALLADKGYTGLENKVQIITAKTKPPNGFLNTADININKWLSQGRVLV